MPGVDLDAYKHQLIERFANPEVRDTLARLCAESSDRIPKWLLPVVRAQPRPPADRSAARRWSSPRWARYAEGVDEQGEPIEIVDRRKDARDGPGRARRRDDPLAFLARPRPVRRPRRRRALHREYVAALDSLHEHGARATLEAWEKRAESL